MNSNEAELNTLLEIKKNAKFVPWNIKEFTWNYRTMEERMKVGKSNPLVKPFKER